MAQLPQNNNQIYTECEWRNCVFGISFGCPGSNKWYDVKKFEINALNFMDKLGRKQILITVL